MSATDDLRSKLAEQAKTDEDRDKAQVWKPAEGDVLEGTVLAIRETQYNPRIELADAEGAVWVINTSPTALRGRVVDLDVQVGDRLAVQFRGTVDTGKPSPVKRFSVVSEPGTQPLGNTRFDWSPHKPGNGHTPATEQPHAEDPWHPAKQGDEPPF